MACFGLSIIFGVISLNLLLVNGQEGCPCHNPSSGARWANQIDPGVCEGICDQATRNETWLCILPSDDQLVCYRTIPCAISASCDGLWSSWQNNGRCNATGCKPGLRRQIRICYRVNEETGERTNMRSYYCLGAEGHNETHRYETCGGRRFCPTAAPSPGATFKISADGDETTPEVANTAFTQTSNPAETTAGKELAPPADSNKAPSQVEPLTLAAVLGSIGLICVAVILISLIVVKRKRAANPRNSRTILSNSSLMNHKPGDELNDYEFVAPVLPNRQLTNSNQSPARDIPVSAPNVLYNHHRSNTVSSHRELNMQRSLDPATRVATLNNSVGVYLEPYHCSTTRSLPIRESVHSEEGVYMSIDDYVK